MRTIDLLCVGAANLDVIAAVDAAPPPDGRVPATQIVHAGGGPAATAAVAAARQGLAVGFCGRVGRDAQGDAVLEGLEAEGVDVSHVKRDRHATTGASVIVVDLSTGSRAICAATAPAPSAIPPGAAPWVHVDQVGHDVLSAGDRAGSHVSIDHGNPITDLDLAGVDLYAPARPMLQADGPGGLDAAAGAAAAAGARDVVITDGRDGAWVRQEATLHLVPGFVVDGPISTLGAGDVFHGALLVGIIRGLPLREAVRRANACAALSCRGLDGRSAIPTAEELDAFLDTCGHTSTSTDHLQPKGTS